MGYRHFDQGTLALVFDDDEYESYAQGGWTPPDYIRFRFPKHMHALFEAYLPDGYEVVTGDTNEELWATAFTLWHGKMGSWGTFTYEPTEFHSLIRIRVFSCDGHVMFLVYGGGCPQSGGTTEVLSNNAAKTVELMKDLTSSAWGPPRLMQNIGESGNDEQRSETGKSNC